MTGLPPFSKYHCPSAAGAGLAGQARLGPAGNHDEVAAAPFDDLAFLRLHPVAAGRAVGPDAVEQDPGIASLFFPRRPGPFAPFPFGDQVIVVKLVARRQAAEFLARDLDHSVVDREDLGGVFVLVLAQIGVESGQILAVEREDRLARLDLAAIPAQTEGASCAWIGDGLDRGSSPDAESKNPTWLEWTRAASMASTPEVDRARFRSLTVNPGTLRATDHLDLGQDVLVRAGDRKDHALAPLDLLGGSDAHAIIGHADLHQELDRQIRRGGVREEGDDPRHALVMRDQPRPNLGSFHLSYVRCQCVSCPSSNPRTSCAKVCCVRSMVSGSNASSQV